MSFLSVSPHQLLNVWDQLHACKNKSNSYAGDVCQIYMFNVMGHSGTFERNPKSIFCRDEAIEANKNVYHICKQFEKRHNVEIEFADGEPLLSLLTDADETPNTWRVELRVKEI